VQIRATVLMFRLRLRLSLELGLGLGLGSALGLVGIEEQTFRIADTNRIKKVIMMQ